MQIKVKTPAKINLTLEIINKRDDGFHNIKSIMQMINLYDYVTINAEPSKNFEIILRGSSTEIPYDESNLVYKATKLYIDFANIPPHKFNIYIEKNIPISAGLAGGSTNAAGTLFGLNKLFKNKIQNLHPLCAMLGSDLNVCLEGGCSLATGRGEQIQKLPPIDCSLSLIKPLNLGVSAKEAYSKYASLKNKPQLNKTEKMIKSLNQGKIYQEDLYNDLETAIFNDYEELQKIKELLPNSIMSGSGSTYFVLNQNIPENIQGYFIKNNLKFITGGVEEVTQ